MRRSNPTWHCCQRLLWVAVYAVAMALLEAVVVVYMRGLLQLSRDHVSLGGYGRIEMWREAGTLAMLVAVGWLAGRHGRERLAHGLFAFGLWDIAYYAWLKWFIDWPATWFDWDILFLLPMRWWGPVLSPMLIAALLCVSAVLALLRMAHGRSLGVTPARVATVVAGGALALIVFMSDALSAWLAGRPDWNVIRPSPFNWPLFLLALALMAWPSLRATWPGGGRRDKAPIQ